MTDVPLWVEVLNKLATPAIAGVSAFYVYQAYRRAQRWKAGDLAASALAQLETHPELSLACHALDWGVGPLIVPERLRLLLKGADGTAPAIMQHDPNLMTVALSPNLKAQTLADPRGLIYRLCFDRLLNHLLEVSRLEQQGQMYANDLKPLAYWLARLADYEYAPDGISGNAVFQPFMKAFNYHAVAHLGAKLGVPFTRVV